MQNFKEFGLKKELIKALDTLGYEKPTLIQQKAIKPIIDGNDIIACAQTGTGKTAAFSLPILNDMERNGNIQALILTPTRELALQINENIREYKKHLKLKSVVIYGGVKQGMQVRALQQGADILVATPGRLLDLVSQKYIDLKNITFFVLDEADNMLDMGFIHDIKKIIKLLPKQRQTLLFSATMPQEIKELANSLMHNPIEVSVAPVSSAVDTVKQSLYYVDKSKKLDLLLEVMDDKRYHSTLIFTRTKHGADKLVKKLKVNKFKVAAIHGNKSQNNRQRTLAEFKEGKINTLVATDIAARGIDIDDLAYVINYEIPNIAETYVHRIGRTGRIGRAGEAISLVDNEEKAFIKDIQKLMNKKIMVIENHSYPLKKKAIVTSKTNSQKNKSNFNKDKKSPFKTDGNKRKSRRSNYKHSKSHKH
ncbi:DEAD/DEAH box helicase [Erysipelotrichaceae bacterium OttesenSCG-928-M19]|nr:DEAD/DEAH box helicase [Erysipelotrichaceae bacterium OttesenSCG-928-M19]